MMKRFFAKEILAGRSQSSLLSFSKAEFADISQKRTRIFVTAANQSEQLQNQLLLLRYADAIVNKHVKIDND